MAKFRIATYNIHKARGLDGRTRVECVAGVLSELDADIVALHEVVNHRGGTYGNVTLTRFEFRSVRHVDLTVSGREERGVLRTDIRLGHMVSGPRIVTRTLSAEFHLTDLRSHLARTRTYPAILPFLHLDHIYLDHHFKIDKARFHRSRLSFLTSDHLPLVADMAL
jgi:endonuclease/exonuclease/phosphatase family metal-dependent hydrolase